MLDELRSQDWLPRSVRSKTKNIEQAVNAPGHRLRRAPTEAEIAEEMGMMLPEYQELLEEARGVQIIHYEDLVRHTEDKQHPLDHQTRSADTQSAQWANPLNQLVSNGLRNALVAAIKGLPEREQLLLSQIGRASCRERVCQ